MEKIHQIKLRFTRSGSTPNPPPGDPRLWAALEQGVGKVQCVRTTLLHVEWDEKAKIPAAPDWAQVLAFPGLHEVSVNDALSDFSLQVRRRGSDPDALVTLVHEWLLRAGFSAPRAVWSARLFEFASAPEILVETLQKMLLLGARSGIYHPAAEEARLWKPGDALAWAQASSEFPADCAKDDKALVRSLREGTSFALRRPYLLSEERKRAAATQKAYNNPLHSLFWEVSANMESRGGVERPQEPGPLTMIGSVPPTADVYSNADRFMRRCEFVASQYDRSPGLITFRRLSSNYPALDVLSPIPLNHQPLGPAPSGAHRLYALGPWDARNYLMERRIECLLPTLADELRAGCEFVDGEQDWLIWLVGVAARNLGWTLEQGQLEFLLRANADRTRFHRCGFFWAGDSAKAFFDRAKELGVELRCVGRADTSSRFRVTDANQKSLWDLGIEELLGLPNEGRDRTTNVAWEYPELKSTTYGYDKAMLFPDQYLLKVMKTDSAQGRWTQRNWLFHSGDRYRSVIMRNKGSDPLRHVRWSDGAGAWAEAVGIQPGWTDVDPRAAGLAAVDAAVRGLIAAGATPKAGGLGSLWLPLPEKEEGEAGQRALAAYLLAFEGACVGAVEYGFQIDALNAGGLSFPQDLQEVIVNLRSRLSTDAPWTVPGFRMEGEVLYALGPKPAFVDAGSRILSHVRVYSNNTSRLVPAAQMELYELIHQLMRKGTITSIRPIYEGGIAEAVGEMALWSGRGASLRPTIPVIELFSGAPGRFVVGILPSAVKDFEKTLKSELAVPIGTVQGEKVLGLPLQRLFEERDS